MPARNPVRRTVDQVRWLQAILRNPMGTFPRATFFCPTSIPLPHLHTGLSKVENMITPADLARMLGQTPDSADSHTQDHLLYTSETPHHSADSGDSSDVGGTASHSTNQAVHQDEVDAVPTAQHSGVPGTPATPATPEPSESEISDAASDMPAPKPMMPTPGHRLRHACHRHHRHYQRHYRGAG